MNRTTLLLIFFCAAIFISSPVNAGNKFLNKDTAKDRKDITFGTGGENTDISIESDSKSNRITIKSKKNDENKNTIVGPIFVTPEIKP